MPRALEMPGFDPGPPPPWERVFAAAPLAAYTDHPSGRFRVDFGPVYYRGRLDGAARIVLVGQDPSTDELLGHRILVGDAGQRVQGLLRKIGITRSYVMVNTYLFGIRGQHDTKMAKIALEPADPGLPQRSSGPTGRYEPHPGRHRRRRGRAPRAGRTGRTARTSQ